MTYTITINEKFNSKEIYFDEKPSETIRESLKALKMRWNNVKKCWYGFAEQNEIKKVMNSTEAKEFQTGGTCSDGYMGGVEYTGNNVDKFGYTSKCFRKAFKACGINNVTVKQESYSGGMTFYFTITAHDSDFVTPEQFAESYYINYRGYGIDYKDENGQHKSIHCSEYGEYFKLSAEQREKIRIGAACYEYERKTKTGAKIDQYRIEGNSVFTKDFLDKLCQIKSIIDSFRYDDSNSMVDYFHTNFYYYLELKHI